MRPVVLGIDTSGTSCSVALVYGSLLYQRRAAVGNAHSQHVLAMVSEVLVEASLSLGQCDAIAYAAGPGSFTGLRVACAVAQGLAFGAGLPVVAVGTLEAIAHSIAHAVLAPMNQRSIRVLVAMDARMGEVYWSVMEWTPNRLRAVAPPALAPAATLRHRIAERTLAPIALGCGNAWAIHGDAMNGLVERVVARDTADAVDVAQLGRIAYEEGRTVAPEDAAPLYVRDEVALTMVERAAERDAKRERESSPRSQAAVEARSATS